MALAVIAGHIVCHLLVHQITSLCLQNANFSTISKAVLPCAAHQVSFCCRAYEGPSCAVCLGNYESGEMIRQLPDCHHHFHQDCIDQWLATHTTCPMCRRSLLPPDPGAVETPVSPSVSPTAHLLPLWADHASRHQQHPEMAVELRPVGCPSPTILLRLSVFAVQIATRDT